MLEFQWDPTKAVSNLQKHGVPFEYATRVFLNERRQDGVDTRHRYGEERRITVSPSRVGQSRYVDAAAAWQAPHSG